MNAIEYDDCGECPRGLCDHCAFCDDDVWTAQLARARARAAIRADPLRPPETDQQPDLTDIATHASGVWLTAVVAVAAAFFVAVYVWARS